MNIYKATVLKSNGNQAEHNVAAKDVAEAVANIARYAKQNYYSTWEILSISKLLTVSVYYATAAKKRK